MDMLMLHETTKAVMDFLQRRAADELAHCLSGWSVCIKFGDVRGLDDKLIVRNDRTQSEEFALPLPGNDRFSARLACIRTLTGNNKQMAQVYDTWTSADIFNAMAPRWTIKELENVPRFLALVDVLRTGSADTRWTLRVAGEPVPRDFPTSKELALLTAMEPLVGMHQLL